ncbi:uncharacterized protein LOC106868869 [Octopus bimaculoides]|uniref:Calponin-homology (CH) domain-containing protein n=1 Tax=Octopus bimaculoides TaxID=37653 RepID=A0A0L8HSB0_OCTBM|nr:uncharacterized protein LOC106868869 [Octopus bimaculoides]|eukprot:XP_014769806.1 PREDICTED: uncharacterized protein LOC106868869 [Octopus bimaculoides]
MRPGLKWTTGSRLCSVISTARVCILLLLHCLLYKIYNQLYWLHSFTPFYIFTKRYRNLNAQNSLGVQLYQPSFHQLLKDILSSEKQRKVNLLIWISNVLPQFQVTNFHTSWNDGIVLCALLNAVCPGLCPHFTFLQPHNRVNNCRLGLQLANDHLNIPTSLIAPEEIAIANNDSTANKIFRLAYMIKLTAQQQKWISFNDCNDIPENPTDLSSSSLVISGSGYKHATVGRKSQFTISSLQKFPTYLKINILGPNASDSFPQKLLRSTITDLQTDLNRQETKTLSFSNPILDYHSDGIFEIDNNGLEIIPYDYKLSMNGTSLVSYIPRKTGVHYISVQRHDTDIDGSPFRVIVSHPISSNPNSKALLLKSLSIDTPALWANNRQVKVKKLRVIRRTVLPNKIKENNDICDISKSSTDVNNTDKDVSSDSSHLFADTNSVTSQGGLASISVASNPSSESIVVDGSPGINTSTDTTYTNSSSSSDTTSTTPVENIQPNYLLNPGDSPNEFYTPSASPRYLSNDRETDSSESEDDSTYYESKDSDEPAQGLIFPERMQSCLNAERVSKISIGSASSAFNKVITQKRRSSPYSEKSSKFSHVDGNLRTTENIEEHCSSENNHCKINLADRGRYRRSFSYNSSLQHTSPKSLKNERSMEVFNWLDNINSPSSDESHHSRKYLLQQPISPLCKNIQMNEKLIKDDGFNSSLECSFCSLYNDEKETFGFDSLQNESKTRSLRKNKTFSVHTPTFPRLPLENMEVPRWKNTSTSCECPNSLSPHETFHEDCRSPPFIWQQQSRCKKCIDALNGKQTGVGCPFYHHDESKCNGENPNKCFRNSSGCLPSCGIHSRIASDPHYCSHMSNKSNSSSTSTERQGDEGKIFKSEVKIFLKNPRNKHNLRVNYDGKCQNKNSSKCENSLTVKKRKLLVLHNYNVDDKKEALNSTVDSNALANSNKEVPTIILEKHTIPNEKENIGTAEDTSQCYVQNWLRKSAKVPVRQFTIETNDSGIAINSRSPSPQRTQEFNERRTMKRKSVCDVTTTPFTKYSDFQKKESDHFKRTEHFVEKSSAKHLHDFNINEYDSFQQFKPNEMEMHRENFEKNSVKYMTPEIFGDLEEFLSSELYNGALLQAILNPNEIDKNSLVNNGNTYNRVDDSVRQKYLTVPYDYRKRDDRSDIYSSDFSPETSEQTPFEKLHSGHRWSEISEKSGLYWDNTLERRKSDIPQVGLCQNHYSDCHTSNQPSGLYRGSFARQYQSYPHGLNELPLTDTEEELHINESFGNQTFTSVSNPAEQNMYFQYFERSDATNVSSLADIEELASIGEPALDELPKCPGCNCCANRVNSSEKFYDTNKMKTSETHMLHNGFEVGNIETGNIYPTNRGVQEQNDSFLGDYTLSDTSLRQWYINESELSHSSDWPPSSISMPTHELLPPSMECLFMSLHKAIAATEERPDSVCYALGPGLEIGYVKTLNFFQVRTVEGTGPLTVGIQGPCPANSVEEISIIYTDYCTYDISYFVTKTGCYTLDIKWAGRHIFQSPFFCQVLPLKE